MDHFLPLLLGLYDGRFAFLLPLFVLCRLASFYSSQSFFSFLPHPLQIRGIRSKIGSNECLLCCIDFLFHIVETLVRFFNKYAYVQVSDVYLFSSFQDVDHAYVKSLHVPAVFCLSFVTPH